MIQVSLNNIIFKVKGYIKENWGSPFIVGFMLLILVVAVSLSAGFASLADMISVYSFYFLVIGVFLQLASFLKYSRKSDDEVDV